MFIKDREAFVCCADKVEKKKQELERDKDRSLLPASHYEGLSRPKKHKADEVRGVAFYVLFFPSKADSLIVLSFLVFLPEIYFRKRIGC